MQIKIVDSVKIKVGWQDKRLRLLLELFWDLFKKVVHLLNFLSGHGLDHIHFLNTKDHGFSGKSDSWSSLTSDTTLPHSSRDCALAVGWGIIERARVTDGWHWSEMIQEWFKWQELHENDILVLARGLPWVTWSESWDTPCHPTRTAPWGFWRQGGSTPWSWSGWAGSPCWRRGCRSSPSRTPGSRQAWASQGCSHAAAPGKKYGKN